MIWLAAVLFVLLWYSVNRVNHLDVETGRRDGDYGSNYGWYWPWTPLIQVCFVGIIIIIIYFG